MIVVHCCSVIKLCQLFVTPWAAAHKASLSFTISRSLLKLMSIESVMPSNHLILYHPILLPPSIFPSTRVFSNESVLRIRWPKYWSFSFNISPSNEDSGLISFRMDWLDLLAVQGTLKSLLQHHSSKASIFWHSTFFIVQFSHPYMTTRETLTLTRWRFVGKVMSLPFNMLSRLAITFLPGSKHLLISHSMGHSVKATDLRAWMPGSEDHWSQLGSGHQMLAEELGRSQSIHFQQDGGLFYARFHLED